MVPNLFFSTSLFYLCFYLAEQALKARKEIADYIKAGRIERARIRVRKLFSFSSLPVFSLSFLLSSFFFFSLPFEIMSHPSLSLYLSLLQVEHIIREDYLVEAMEVIELYCDLLLARFGMIATMQ